MLDVLFPRENINIFVWRELFNIKCLREYINRKRSTTDYYIKHYINRNCWQPCLPSWRPSEYEQGYPVNGVPVTQLTWVTRRVYVPETDHTLPSAIFIRINTFFCLHRFPLVVWLTQSSGVALSQQIRLAASYFRTYQYELKGRMLIISISTTLTHHFASSSSE